MDFNSILQLHFSCAYPGNTSKKHKTYHICWNRGDHERKFLKNPGIYLENDCYKNSDLVFWGEWEPQSDVIQHFDETRKEIWRQ